VNITDGDSASPKSPALAVENRLRRLRVLVLVVLAGVALSLAVMFALRRSLPPLAASELAAAKARWAEAGPSDYEVEIVVHGAQPAIYVVEVKARRAISATRNGVQLKQPRTWETWTVPGMFGTLECDVQSLEEGVQLVVRCQFHPEFGYPARYESFRADTRHQVDWEVTRFDVH
jgi:hypothetical protein